MAGNENPAGEDVQNNDVIGNSVPTNEAGTYSRWLSQILSRWGISYDTIKTAVIAAVIVINISCISLCVSAFLFGTIYFYHMPTVQHSFPLYFHYNMSCIQHHKVIERGLHWDRYSSAAYVQDCFPVAKVDLALPNHPKLLQEGQVYSVLLTLELPETPNNLNIGQFMASTVIEGRSSTTPIKPGEYRWSRRRSGAEVEDLPVILSSSKPMIMRYKSLILRYAYTLLLWPLLLFDFLPETQVLNEVLFEDLMLEQKSYNWTLSVYLEAPAIELYSAKLDLVAQFSGLQYLLYRWPIVSFVFGTLSFFLPTLFTNAILFYFAFWRPFFSSQPPTLQRSNRPVLISRSVQQPPAVESVPLSVTSSHNDSHSEENPPPPGIRNDVSVSTSLLSAPELIGSEPSIGGYSRRSSSSSSIEMITQPSQFPSAEEETTFLAQSSLAFQAQDNSQQIDNSDRTDVGLRRRTTGDEPTN